MCLLLVTHFQLLPPTGADPEVTKAPIFTQASSNKTWQGWLADYGLMAPGWLWFDGLVNKVLVILVLWHSHQAEDNSAMFLHAKPLSLNLSDKKTLSSCLNSFALSCDFIQNFLCFYTPVLAFGQGMIIPLGKI